MRAIKLQSTLDMDGKLVLDKLPFQKGQKVEILIYEDESDRQKRVVAMEALFEELQSKNKELQLSDDEIQEEIESYRGGN